MQRYKPINTLPPMCLNCRFADQDLRELEAYRCCIGRPTVNPETQAAVWPIVRGADFCGEHERKYVIDYEPTYNINIRG